jgi:hypothetical protein
VRKRGNEDEREREREWNRRSRYRQKPLSPPQPSSKFQDREIGASSRGGGGFHFIGSPFSTNGLFFHSEKPDKKFLSLEPANHCCLTRFQNEQMLSVVAKGGNSHALVSLTARDVSWWPDGSSWRFVYLYGTVTLVQCRGCEVSKWKDDLQFECTSRRRRCLAMRYPEFNSVWVPPWDELRYSQHLSLEYSFVLRCV